MGRRRKTLKHLPRWMVHSNGAFYLKRGAKWIRLGAEYGPALIEYAKLVGSAPKVTTVAGIITQYLATSAGRLAPKTLEGYQRSADRLAAVFGDLALDDLSAAHVYRYLVEHGNVQANRDRALLSAAYTHARRTGAFAGDDPTKKLQFRNEEKPRDRYVTDAEMSKLVETISPKLACIARFIELTGLRQGDALRVRLADIDDSDDGGIYFQAGKTTKKSIIGWSDELRAVIADARRLWRRFGREYLFESKPRGRHAKRGPGPYTPSGLRALWRVARAEAGLPDVRLHDLRGKAGSDVETDAEAQELLQHSDPKVTRRHYRRKPKRLKPVR